MPSSRHARLSAFGLALLLGACGGAQSQASAGTSTDELPPAPRVSGAEARARVAAGALLLDVTPPSRANDSFIEGRVHIPISELAERMDELPRDRPIVVYCYGGRGSPRAGAMLQAAGYDVVVMGPRSAWFDGATEAGATEAGAADGATDAGATQADGATEAGAAEGATEAEGGVAEAESQP